MTDPTIEPEADPGTAPSHHVHPDPAPDPKTAERRRQAVLAGHNGDTDTARCLADDPEAVVRAAALGALSRTGTLTDDELAWGLTDPHPTVRLRALEILGEPTPMSCLLTGLLVKLLVDPMPEVVETACWAAGEHPEEADQLVDSVVAVAGTGPDGDRPGHPDHLCREAAVAALGALGHELGRESVLAGLGQRATIRRRAVLALAAFKGDGIEAALTRALDDRDWQVRQAAEDLLGVNADPG
ncbi:MAG: hypothetical protein VYD11_04210 [Actinomycetota bacterium]|nr:hypothetical protein [Actinomycetota bacterium]MED5220819.1 hypothetical protein [Actinomycetota bacterium]MEE3353024.1 hypothetical protein [Actinomycetota bacterium]